MNKVRFEQVVRNSARAFTIRGINVLNVLIIANDREVRKSPRKISNLIAQDERPRCWRFYWVWKGFWHVTFNNVSLSLIRPLKIDSFSLNRPAVHVIHDPLPIYCKSRPEIFWLNVDNLFGKRIMSWRCSWSTCSCQTSESALYVDPFRKQLVILTGVLIFFEENV